MEWPFSHPTYSNVTWIESGGVGVACRCDVAAAEEAAVGDDGGGDVWVCWAADAAGGKDDAVADVATAGGAVGVAAGAAVGQTSWPVLTCACDAGGAVRPPPHRRSAAPCHRWQTSPFSTSPATLHTHDCHHFAKSTTHTQETNKIDFFTFRGN